MKVKELKAALAKLDAKYDDKDVVVWLPGSRIDLTGTPKVYHADKGLPPALLIEGNLREGSALS